MVAEDSVQYRIGRPRSCECGECRKCRKADYMREYYRNASIERRRGWVAGRDPERVSEANRKRVRPEVNKVRNRARLKVKRAILAGMLVRLPCERCGEPKTQAHHEDYERPLDVNWLCSLHHAARHRERVEEQSV